MPFKSLLRLFATADRLGNESFFPQRATSCFLPSLRQVRKLLSFTLFHLLYGSLQPLFSSGGWLCLILSKLQRILPFNTSGNFLPTLTTDSFLCCLSVIPPIPFPLLLPASSLIPIFPQLVSPFLLLCSLFIVLSPSSSVWLKRSRRPLS